jgi:hypothetical protein
LPPGHYVPKFLHIAEPETAANLLVAETNHSQAANVTTAQAVANPPLEAASLAGREQQPRHFETKKRPISQYRVLAIPAVVVLAAGVLSAFFWYRLNRSSNREGLPPVLASISGQALRATAGDGRARYVDRSGDTWETDRFCSGGNSFSASGHTIQGTEDAQLFLAGRHGAFQCRYPVGPGTYEVHLLFAETSGLLENIRNVAFSINGGQVINLDVVDDAGGDDIATTKVFTGVQPQSDGTIHVDFNAPDSFLNAVEILPGASHGIVPVRIIAGPSIYRDSNGNVWAPDHYFFGGRVNRFAKDLSKVPDGRLFEWHRYGHFHYVVPVATSGKYTLKLYFLEHWFGVENGSIGGVGSRVFDVSCDGRMLLQHFDIFSEAGTGPLVKTFSHLEPTPQGKLEIYFTPAMNYPSVSAIEVLAE